MRVPLLLIAALAVPPTARAWGQECRAQEPREAKVDAQGAQTLRVLAGAGSLRIVGEAGLSEVVVKAKACAHDPETLQSIRLLAHRSGSEVRVEAELPRGFSGIGTFYARLDLELHVPASLAADVEDSSGEAAVAGVASLRLRDSSGSIEVTDVKGEVWLRDGSGEIEVRNVGSLIIDDDGSGGIRASGVSGDVRIREDGSGEIDLRDVTGNVTVEDDGSGGIGVRNVGGDFIVRHAGSGSINYEGVKGRVDVPKHRR
jgi:hypothetical protein